MRNIVIHPLPGGPAAEFVADNLILSAENDAIPLIEDLFASGARKVIIHKENIIPEFFDLSTRLAGLILQKFTNYYIQVAIVGDFSHVSSKALNAFIFESNRGNQVFFIPTLEAALEKMA